MEMALQRLGIMKIYFQLFQFAELDLIVMCYEGMSCWLAWWIESMQALGRQTNVVQRTISWPTWTTEWDVVSNKTNKQKKSKTNSHLKQKQNQFLWLP